MNKLVDSSSMPPYLDAMQCASGQCTKMYSSNTLKEFGNWQYRNAPKVTGVSASGRWQGGGAEVVG